MALSALLGLIAAAAPAGAGTETRSYRCFDDSSFTMVLNSSEAIVRFKDGEYRLPRKPSSIAIKYADARATLYLDHDFAAFVADDRTLPGCTRVRPDAGAAKP